MRGLSLCFLALLSVLPAANSQESSTNAAGLKLVGGVSHSSKLEAMPESERVGSDVTAGMSSGAQAAASQVDMSRQVVNPVPSVPRANPISLMSRPAHIDPTQDNYKKLLRQLAVQNSTTRAFRPVSKVVKVPIRIPAWLAGVWQRTETNELSRQELPSGKPMKALGKQTALITDVFGTYKDKKGQIFMLVPLMATGAVDRGFAVDYHKVRKYELSMVGKNAAVVKVQASHQVVNKRTGKVVDAYQDEELNQYTLIEDGLVRTDSSVKVFDQLGAARMLTRAVSMEKRLRKFL